MQSKKIYRKNIENDIYLVTRSCNRFFWEANICFFGLLPTLFGKTYVRRVYPNFNKIRGNIRMYIHVTMRSARI
jgi:hypothetical protein